MADRTVSVKLKAEISQYMSAMRTAGRVTSDLEKASFKVKDSFDAVEDAAGRLRVAQAKLNELQASGTAKASQLAQAQEQLASAQREHTRAQERAIIVTQDFIDDQTKLATATDNTTDSVEKMGRSTEKVAKRANLQWRLLMGAIAVGAPAASAAALGVAIGGVSTAFIGLGAVALRENEKVLGSVRELGDTVSTGLADDASVMEGAFVGAADRMGAAYQGLRPQLVNAFSAAAPLVGTLTEGVVDFAENAMPGMVRSVQRAGPVMDGFASLLGDTGQGLGDFFDVISEHSEEAGEGVEHLGTLIGGVLPEIGGLLGNLTDLWAEHGDEVADVVTRLIGALGGLTGSALPVLSTAAGAALDVLGGVLDVIEPMLPILGPLVGAWLSLALAMKSMRGVQSLVSGVATSVGILGDNADKSARKSKALKLGLAGLALAGGSVFAQMSDLNPQVDALGVSMDRWARTGEASGEAARLLGGDMGELEYALQALTSNGLDKGIASLIEFGPGLIGIQGPLGEAKERVGALDQALAGMVESGNAEEAGRIVQAMAERAGVSIEEVKGLLPGYTGALESAAASTANMAAETDNARLALEGFAEQQRLATDPIFAMQDAVEKVGDAQKAYNEAVEEYGKKSPEAESAAWDLAEAVAGAEQAALNGDLSFGAFKDKLAVWVQQGLITQGQADTLAGRVANLRGEAEDYAGVYGARLNAKDNASHIIGHVKGELLGLRDKTVTITTRFVSAGHGPTATNRLLSSTGADGGLVTPRGILPRFADGGVVRGPGGPRSDIVPALLSNGEFVVNAASTAKFLPLLKALNAEKFADGGPVGMANGGRVGGLGGLVATEAFVKLGDVTDDEWRALLDAGWQGRAGDQMEALYPPMRKAADGFVRLGDATDAEWGALLAAGWRGVAGDKMEALYPPMDRLRVAIDKTASGLGKTIRPLTGKAAAAAEMLGAIAAGREFFEDFSFQGMKKGGNADRFQEQLMDEFYRRNPGVDFGTKASRTAVQRFLHGFSTGGGVFGAGSSTVDSIPALLAPGEHVWSAAEVAASGGHAAMEAMRRAARGGVRGMASGGAVMQVPMQRGGTTFVDNRQFHFPNYVGSKDELVTALRSKVNGEGGGNVQKYLGRG